MLVTVPDGEYGPGGVLVCAKNFVTYKNQNQPDVCVVIPRRQDLPLNRGVSIVCAVTHKQKGLFFFLLQTEDGDIFIVTLDCDKDDRVIELKLEYFDTIPVASAMCILKTGYLVATLEFGNRSVYQFLGIGGDSEVESSSATLEETEGGYRPVFFMPRELKNLVQIDDIESLMEILNLNR